MITLYEKAAAIALKLYEIDNNIDIRPEWILRRASPEDIDFFYGKIAAGKEYTIKRWL